MVDANKIIEDIIKGAQQTEGFMRGGAMGIERQILGEETKLAGDHAGLGAALGGPIGAAIGAESGHRGDAALGSLGGGLAGSVAGGGAGALIGLLARNPALAAQLGIGGANVGGFAGGVYGAHEMGKSHSRQLQDKFSSVKVGDNLAGVGNVLLGPVGAALGAEGGHRGEAAIGSIGGGLGGALAGGGAGALIGLLARNPSLAAELGVGGASFGGLAGSTYGAHRGGRSGVDRLRAKLSADNALPAAYLAGVKEACDHFKVAFAGLLPAITGLATKAAPLATKALANPTVRSLGAQAGGGAAMQAGMNAMVPKQPQ